jgi:hypothetical protein
MHRINDKSCHHWTINVKEMTTVIWVLQMFINRKVVNMVSQEICIRSKRGVHIAKQNRLVWQFTFLNASVTTPIPGMNFRSVKLARLL